MSSNIEDIAQQLDLIFYSYREIANTAALIRYATRELDRSA
jgi:hypothetical protein